MYWNNKNNGICFFVFLLFVLHSYADDGDLDPTFGTGGIVTTTFGVGASNAANDIVIQTNGKIIAVGSTSALGNTDFAVARYDTNGALDTTFNGTGLVITSFGIGTDIARGVALQDDGKIVVVGAAFISSNNNFGIVRYNTDGSLDTTFGSGGIVTTTFGVSSSDIAFAVVIQPDGKIVVVGSTTALGNTDFAVARYNTNGSLDTTFGTGGLVTTSFTGSIDIANAVVLQPDGKIIAAGTSNGSGNNDFAVTRYNTNGSLDTTFGTGGLVTTNFTGASNDSGNAVVLQSDGKIIVAGTSNGSGNNDFAVARYNTNGSLDTTFGTGGLVTTNFTVSSNDVANTVVLQTNGTIIVAGASSGDLALARYTPTGVLDSTFGNGGLVVTSVPGGTNDIINGMALQVDGKIVVAGQIVLPPSNFVLARYENCPGFSVVGSDSVLTLFTTPQVTLPGGRFAKLAMLQGGFGLCGDATFDSCFPVVGTICLACNTLIMQQDIIMDNISYVASLGNIIGNGHVLELSQSVTVLPNFVCTDPLTAAVTTCTGVEWGNLVVELNSDVTIQETIITFTGVSTLVGNDNTIILDDNSAIVVGTNSQLLMKNITFQGVNGIKIRCLDDQSLLMLENVTWILDDDYNFVTGSFNIARDFYITGENCLFNYQSNVASMIGVGGRLIIGHNLTFRYAPPTLLKELLIFAENYSQLVLKGGILRASNVGMNLLRGTLRICRSSTLFSEGIDISQGISLGDGITSDNNLKIDIDPAAQLVIDGPVIYNNV